MPRTKKSLDSLVMIIRAYGYNGLTLADVIETSHQTALNRLRYPETFTLREIRLLQKKGHIPIDELRDAI